MHGHPDKTSQGSGKLSLAWYMPWVEGQRKSRHQIANLLCILTVCAIIFTVNYSIPITQQIPRAGWKERYPALLRSPGDLVQILQSAG